jgi:hypothetical protein
MDINCCPSEHNCCCHQKQQPQSWPGTYTGLVERTATSGKSGNVSHHLAIRVCPHRVMSLYSSNAFFQVPLVLPGDKVRFELDNNGTMLSFDILYDTKVDGD